MLSWSWILTQSIMLNLTQEIFNLQNQVLLVILIINRQSQMIFEISSKRQRKILLILKLNSLKLMQRFLRFLQQFQTYKKIQLIYKPKHQLVLHNFLKFKLRLIILKLEITKNLQIKLQILVIIQIQKLPQVLWLQYEIKILMLELKITKYLLQMLLLVLNQMQILLITKLNLDIKHLLKDMKIFLRRSIVLKQHALHDLHNEHYFYQIFSTIFFKYISKLIKINLPLKNKIITQIILQIFLLILSQNSYPVQHSQFSQHFNPISENNSNKIKINQKFEFIQQYKKVQQYRIQKTLFIHTIIKIENKEQKMFEHEFDAKQIQQALPDYKYIKKIGCGAFATVHLVQKKDSQQKYAIKKVSCFGMDQYQKLGVTNQVRILSSLDHKNIIKLYSCIFDNIEQKFYIFMQYAQNGDLTSLIQQAKEKKKRIPQSTMWKILNDISDSLNYLHSNNIIHRDLKPANVFRMEHNFKIGDMNVSKILKNGEAASTKTGSPYYTAPQMWNQASYDNKCDIWSLGVMLYQLCSLQVPFEGNSIHQLLSEIKKQKNMNLPTFYSSTLNNLYKKMLQQNPIKRITSQQIFKIASQKLQIQIQNQALDEKSINVLMDTIVFPDTHQRWISLIPTSLPPKTSRKEITSSQISARSRSQTKNQITDNKSGIFKSNRRQLLLPKSRSRSKIQSNNQSKCTILPPICKNSPQIPKRSVEQRSIKSREKRQTSKGSRNQNKSIINLGKDSFIKQ